MKVQVLYFVGCPNHRPTVELARQVVAQFGLNAEVEEVEVASGDDAAALRFLGSPTVLVDGVDIEPGARDRRDFGFSCRTYDGAGAPSQELMVAAIESVARLAEGGESVTPGGRSGLWPGGPKNRDNG